MDILARRLTLASVLAALAAVSASAAGLIRLVPNGSVDVRAAAGASWRPVGGEETITAGMEVRTHRSSTAQLKFEDGSVVQINSYSIFAVDKTDTQETSFSLKLGKIRAAFAGLLSSRVNIRTPTAVCAVRGTVFDIGVDGKDTQVTMAEGVLEVKDNNGKQAVVTSEETIRIGEHGMEKPRMLALNDPGSLRAVRPYQVHQEMGRDSTRRMLEDLRNRELKANEAQLGKDVVDAFGRRVRLEEYLLRPDTQSFEVLFLSKRQDRFDWGHLIEQFNAPIPNDLSQVPAIVAGSIFAVNQPSNYLKSMEFYATNTIDAEKEVIALGAPTQINFAGYNAGTALNLWYPSSIDFTQTLYGPGVPGGSRIQFQQHQDYGTTSAGLFTWTQSVINNVGVLASLDQFQLNPASTVDVAATGCGLGGDVCFDNSPPALNALGGLGNGAFVGMLAPAITYPNGANKADLFQQTTYADGSTVAVEKFLISNDGKILDFSNPTSSIFSNNGDYNLEINIKSNLYQGRDIDVLIAPQILSTKGTATKTPDQPSFNP
jgi:hypothetical protein